MTLAAHDVRPSLSCRFYEEKFPELHEAVNTNVTEIGEMGAYVKLLEYNNVGGKLFKIIYSISRKRRIDLNIQNRENLLFSACKGCFLRIHF